MPQPARMPQVALSTGDALVTAAMLLRCRSSPGTSMPEPARVLQVKLKKRDALVTAAMHLRRKEAPATAASLGNLIACFKVRRAAGLRCAACAGHGGGAVLRCSA